MASIYLAGKISGEDDWRYDLVEGLPRVSAEEDWPTLNNAIFKRFDYVGPYHVVGECRCGHCSHGGVSWCGDNINYADTVSRCLQAINEADVLFTWLDDPTAYGTIAEVGYAVAGRGHTVVAVPPSLGRHRSDLWFPITMADTIIEGAETPALALYSALKRLDLIQPAPRFDSPIEKQFWDAYQLSPHRDGVLKGLVTQHTVGPYRVDFAIPTSRIGIELDGYEYHSEKEVFTSDRKRQRQLEANGWRLIRFSGVEVYHEPDRCVNEAAWVVAKWDQK